MKKITLLSVFLTSLFLSMGSFFVEAVEVSVFTIEINGEQYTYSQSISPSFPIMATFLHPDPRVTHVRMQHPSDPNRQMTFKIGRRVQIVNHESHMRAGHESQSVFIALDDKGNAYGRITLTFMPHR